MVSGAGGGQPVRQRKSEPGLRQRAGIDASEHAGRRDRYTKLAEVDRTSREALKRATGTMPWRGKLQLHRWC